VKSKGNQSYNACAIIDVSTIDDDESDPAYLDHIGQLSGKMAKPDAYDG
jgi:hypothetical protein